MTKQEHQLRVNVKSLAAEAKIIRHEVRRTTDAKVKQSLSWHRTHRVRPEARLANLALAYVRGVPYRACEPSTHNPLKPADVIKKLTRFGVNPKPSEVADWLQ